MLRVPPDLPGLRVLLGLRDLQARREHRGLLDRLALLVQRARRELQGRQARLALREPRGLLARLVLQAPPALLGLREPGLPMGIRVTSPSLLLVPPGRSIVR